jgi:hypothetical protein
VEKTVAGAERKKPDSCACWDTGFLNGRRLGRLDIIDYEADWTTSEFPCYSLFFFHV